MKIRANELQWLAETFPALTYQPRKNTIGGMFRFRAAYDKRSDLLEWGDHQDFGSSSISLSSSYEIEIRLGVEDVNGWPKVRETGGRLQEIAAQLSCELEDLHLSRDGSCCLGIRLTRDRNLTLERLMVGLVLPFFYRLSYVDVFGLAAARRDLWGEYGHYEAGKEEYIAEMLSLAGPHLRNNDPCPCGSGNKFKDCHRSEVWAAKKIQEKASSADLYIPPEPENYLAGTTTW